MITIIHPTFGRYNLNTIEHFGIEWGNTFDNVKSKNSLVKIPGGKNLNYGSETEPTGIKVKLMTNYIDLDILDKTKKEILKRCLSPLGTAMEVDLAINPFNGRKRAILSSLTTDVATDICSINIEFTFIDPEILGSKKTIEKSNLTVTTSGVVIANKDDYFGAFVTIKLNGTNLKNIAIVSQDDLGNKYTIEVGNVNSSLVFNNDTFDILVDGSRKLVHIPSKFRFFKYLKISGSGTITKSTVEYVESWV